MKGITRATDKLAKEEADLEEKLIGGQKKLDHNKNGKIDSHDFHLMRKKKMKEEVEGLDEISRDTARSYIRKAMAHKTTGETPKKDRSAGVNLAGKKAYGIGSKAKVPATESVEQIDEISKKTLSSYVKKATGDAVTKAYKAGDVRDKDSGKNYMKALGRQIGISKATDRLTKEESELEEKLVGGQKKLDHNKNGKIDAHDFHLMRKKKMKEEAEQLDELSPNTLKSYAAKSYNQANTLAKQSLSDQPKSVQKASTAAFKRRSAGIKATARRLGSDEMKKIHKDVVGESVEQLDELSPNTLHSYIKKAAGNMAGNAAVAAAQASSSMKKSSPDVKRNIRNRMRGITGASGRLADKANMAENAWEEVPMMMRQLQFIAYGAEEIMEYLDMDIDPEEWFQNKLAHVHDQMQTLHAYMEGDKRMMTKMDYRMYGEEAELEESWSDGVSSRNAPMHARAAAQYRNKAKDSASMAKRHDEGSSEHNKHMAAHHSAMAKSIKSSYHAGDYGSVGAAKKDHKEHMSKAKEYKSSMNEGVELDEVTDQERLSARKIQRDAQTARHGIARKPSESMVAYLNRAKKHKEKMQKEEVELDESITKMTNGRLKFHMNTGTPHGSYTKDEMKAERDRRLKTDPIAYRSAKASINEVTQSAVKKTVTFTGSDGKSHTRNVPLKRIDRDEHGQEKIRESVELDEAFKVGMLKLNDGGSVILKKEDVDVLNGLFKSLSSTNRKKMESTAMKDKNGFNEILSFAREAI
jgi:hypothetical protein